MELKNVIHYYLGCDIIIDDKDRGKLIGGDFIPNSIGQIYYNIVTPEMIANEEEDFSMPYNDDPDMGPLRIKPIFRKLEDMQEDEMKEIFFLIFRRRFHDSGRIQFIDKETTSGCKRWCLMSGLDRVGIEWNGTVWADCDLSHYKYNPHIVTHYLIKQGFDIFDLIPSGQAIDAKIIKK